MNAIDYIISFLLYGREDATTLVGYTNDHSLWAKYKLVILPRRDSLHDLYIPNLDLRPTATKVDDTLVVEEDIVYNTFFLLSRAEEKLNTQRDEYGRFLAKYSILGEQNRLLMPIIDEYSRFLLKTLDLPLPKSEIHKINLTHDIDILTRYRNFRSFNTAIPKGEFRQALHAAFRVENDPAWTFPWIANQDRQFVRETSIPTDIIYFFKNNNFYGLDLPHYQRRDLRRLIQILRETPIRAGLHSSFESGQHYDQCYNELELMKIALEELQPESINRTHFLRSTEPEHLTALAHLGIKEDYTMAFADRAGFRFGTTRPSQWIDPTTTEVTDLTVYPLTVMDCTLSENKYMNLNEEEAFYYCQQLIDKTRMHGGTMTLLFHNQLLTPNSYHRTLYSELLHTLVLLSR